MVHEFAALTDSRLPDVNRALQKKKLAATAAVSEEDWKKAHGDSEQAGGGAHGGGQFDLGQVLLGLSAMRGRNRPPSLSTRASTFCRR